MHTYVKSVLAFCRRNQKIILAIVLAIVLLVALYLMTQPTVAVSSGNNVPMSGVPNQESFTAGDATSSTGEVEYTTGPVEWDADKEVAIVFHRMPTCGPCKAFTPVWQKVSSGLRGKKDKSGRAIRLFVVDQHHPLSEDVNGFPTIRKHINREEYNEFNGPRTEENLSSFIVGA